ncbi:hypothetical protein CHELA20_11743 [Hyphomicrobiales bacterium]|nr:hypothetical protein CHELA20_11743 [Hyphomicrobiales bacterium]CAH1689870.1 hypothetical protein CHELA41_50197 [Hyphomicrobiales bacterium]
MPTEEASASMMRIGRLTYRLIAFCEGLLAKEAIENYSVNSAKRFAFGVREKCGC